MLGTVPNGLLESCGDSLYVCRGVPMYSNKLPTNSLVGWAPASLDKGSCTLGDSNVVREGKKGDSIGLRGGRNGRSSMIRDCCTGDSPDTDCISHRSCLISASSFEIVWYICILSTLLSEAAPPWPKRDRAQSFFKYSLLLGQLSLNCDLGV